MLHDGDLFTADIKGVSCSGMICKHNDKYYLLQDRVSGEDCPDKHGYRYSYTIKHGSVSDLIDTRVTDLVIKKQGAIRECRFKVGDRVKLTKKAQDPSYHFIYGSNITHLGSKATVTEIRFYDNVTRMYKMIVRFDSGILVTMSDEEFDVDIPEKHCVLKKDDIFKFEGYFYIVLYKYESHFCVWAESGNTTTILSDKLYDILPIDKLDFKNFPFIYVGTYLEQVVLTNMSSTFDGISPCGKVPSGAILRVTKVGKWKNMNTKDRYLPFQANYNGTLYHCCLSCQNIYKLVIPVPDLTACYPDREFKPLSWEPTLMCWNSTTASFGRSSYKEIPGKLEFKTQKKITV